jgi:hypothetical protein
VTRARLQFARIFCHSGRSFARFSLFAFIICISAACIPENASAQSPEPLQGSSTRVPNQDDESTVPRPVFELHSGFWLNLHHFLYEQARLRDQESTSRGKVSGPAQDSGAAEGRGADSRPWQAAVNYYAKNLARRDLLIDQGMVLINNRLADLETCADLSGRQSSTCASGLPPALIAALEEAAPLYRQRWWPDHDRKNRAWISSVAPLIRRTGLPLAQELSAVYHAQWQTDPIRVDVSEYAGPFGAYTSLDPTHITVSSTDPRNQGLSGFEILFHESSHALATTVQDAIDNACHDRGVAIPRDLWHALLFYTTGEVVRRAVADGKLNYPESTAPKFPASYTPYAYRNGLYTRGWENYQRVLETYWQPYLDGKTDFNHSITAVVSAL